MQHKQTWRELLGQLIESVQERQRIADAIGVTPTTLSRWASGESKPRPESLRRLLAALPQNHEYLQFLIEKEFPDFALFMTSGMSQDSSTSIPSEFYASVLHTLASIPRNLRFSSLCDLILQQALEQLDPLRKGMAVIVVSFIPPAAGEKVQSLRERAGRGTPPWGLHLEHQGILLGAESLVGYTIASWHVESNPHLKQASIAPGYRDQWEESAVAAPILYLNNIAGSLLVASTQPDYFTPSINTLIEQYAELLALLFESEDFYEASRIALRVMPTSDRQRAYLLKFQERLIQTMTQAQREGQPITLIQAERIVWKQIEHDLIQLTSQHV